MKGRRIVPLVGVLAGGLVHSLLPYAAFGPYLRAAIVATVAGLTTGALLAWTGQRAANG